MQHDIIIDKRDNVKVITEAQGNVPAGHKIALCDIAKGDYVIKYGAPIGRASTDIKCGEWVHSHNLISHLDESASYTYDFSADQPEHEERTFNGFLRDDGSVGIRNEIFIIPTVGCVNNVCMRLERMAQKLVGGSLDGIYALTHQFGCSQLGEDQENIIRLLSTIVKHPNAAYVLIVGLGCENTRISLLQERLTDRTNIAYLTCQEVKDELQVGYEILQSFAEKAKTLQRTCVPMSKLCIGLKCGGSDGFSGITANPLVGRISDRIVAMGGSAILTEVPEMFGAEQRLMNKCASREVFTAYKEMIESFKDFYTKQGFPVYENPSPGNKEGGITTLEEKSLGCIQKAGGTPIVDVLGYGECTKKSGVSVLNAPGNDLIAATALAAAGCQIVLFTTGRGTPFSTFTPTMKLSSNKPLAEFKSNWIDFDTSSMDEEALFALITDTIEGRVKCKSEDIREIAFFKTGVTL